MAVGRSAEVFDRPDMLGKAGVKDHTGSSPRFWVFIQYDALEK